MTTKNNVISMNTSADYTTPDLAIMNSSIVKMQDSMAVAQVAFNKNNYLPSLVTKFSRWITAAVTGRQVLGESCQRMVIGFDSTVKKLRALSNEYTECNDPEEQKDILEEIKNAISSSTGTAQAEAKKLTSNLSDMNGGFDQSATTDYLAGFKLDLERLSPELEKLNAQREVLSDKRKVLTDAIGALEISGIAEAAKDAILTAEKLAELGLQPPQMALVQLALEQLKKQIDNANATFNYLSLVGERDSLRKGIDALAASITESEKKTGDIAERVKLIEAIHIIDDNRVMLVGEFKHVVVSVELFLKLNDMPADDDDALTLRFINDAIQLSDYLGKIR